MKSELDQNFWAIVTATEIVCVNKTYEQCQMMIDTQCLNPNEATIVTSATAMRMLQSQIDKKRGLNNEYTNDNN